MKLLPIMTAILFITVLSIMSCATSGVDRSTSNLDQMLIENPDLSLLDYLRRVSGIQVSEIGDDVRVTIRGAASVSGDNSPLFVVNGSQIGRNFSSVENIVDVKDVASIRVMRSSEAMTMYGMTASNGAVIIITRRGR